MTIIDERRSYQPFEYEEAHDFFVRQQQSHWLWSEFSMNSSVDDWNHKLTEEEKNIIAGVLLGFTQTELYIGSYWAQKVPVWFPKPEISLMGLTFASFEVIHSKAYNYLSETLGLEEYDAFLQNPTASAKLNNFISCPSGSLAEKALSLAVYSGFGEGVSLYSSFAILLYFSARGLIKEIKSSSSPEEVTDKYGFKGNHLEMPKENLLKGVGEIIAYSVRDECHSPDTEVLTENGWVRFPDLAEGVKVAQFNLETKEVTFVVPSRIVKKDYQGKMIKFGGEKVCFKANVTENHDMVQKWNYATRYSKVPAKDLKLMPNKHVPLAGYKVTGYLQYLTALQRFRIATQADGSISNRYTGERCGTVPVQFTFSKERKILRFEEILSLLGFTYKVTRNIKKKGKAKPQTAYVVNVPVEVSISKDFNWVDLTQVTSNWVDEFLQELKEWDGHEPKDGNYIYYSSVVEENVKTIQAICSLGGYSTTKKIQVDKRSETYSSVHRLYIHKKDYKLLGHTTKEVYEYDGFVYCATVPEGSLITKYEDSVSITGNCVHTTAGCWLFRQLLAEFPELDTKELEGDIYEAARTVVSLEADFIDMVFDKHALPGLNADNVKAFIERRANQKLEELGYPSIFDPDVDKAKEIETWFYLMTAGESSTDFFASRVSNYAKGKFNVDNIDWDVVFA